VLKYQLGNDAAGFIDSANLSKNKIVIYGIHEGRAFHFYGQHIFMERRHIKEILPWEIVLTSKDSLPVFKQNFPAMQVLHEGPHFGVSALSLPFLNPRTRDAEVPKYVLVDLDGKP
jgi:hypothetical protein